MIDDKGELLWQRSAAGDVEAFATLYLRHSDRVYTHCYRRTLVPEDAEDLTAEVFTKTWERRSQITLSSDSDILAWLLGTANKLLLQRIASRGRVQAVTDSLVSQARVEAIRQARDVEEANADEERLQVIHQVMAELDPADEEVIWLCVIEGIPPTALAGVLEQPPSTVRSRLRRALNRSRAAYRRLDAV